MFSLENTKTKEAVIDYCKAIKQQNNHYVMKKQKARKQRKIKHQNKKRESLWDYCFAIK
jgi:hypothetical protein